MCKALKSNPQCFSTSTYDGQTSVLCGTFKHFWVQVKEVVFSKICQAEGVRGRGVWPDFQLSAHKLHFTFQLLPVPLDSKQGREQRPQAGKVGGGVWVGVTGRVGARSWANRPWKFPLYVSALSRMGGVLSWSWIWSWS